MKREQHKKANARFKQLQDKKKGTKEALKDLVRLSEKYNGKIPAEIPAHITRIGKQ